MSCILSSQGVVLATTMVVSGTLLLLALFRDKNFPPTHELVSENQDSHSSIPILRSCFCSGGKRGERKKKKKVKFADDVKDDSNGRKSGGELRKKRKEVVDDASCGILQFQRMPPNRVALYGGILRDRLHRMECTKAVVVSCNINRKLISLADEPLKGQKFNARTVAKPSISEDFWTNSTLTWTIVHFSHEEASRQSATATLDASSSGNGNIPSEFVNHGLLLWNQTRQQWVGNKKSENRAQQLCEPRLSWNATYESLLASNKCFTKPIPLAEMVDFLVDIWEQEGIYD